MRKYKAKNPRPKADERLSAVKTIKVMRKALKIWKTKTAMAEQLGLSWTAVNKYCKGEARIPKGYAETLLEG